MTESSHPRTEIWVEQADSGWWRVHVQYPSGAPSQLAGMRHKSRAVDHAQQLANRRGWHYAGVREHGNDSASKTG